ncbi:MAG TPA: tetratricopeptide repeat protein, partial [Rhodopila sp.]|nr:tetratricopeptide repeat protein [Rhodopila sp.]
PLFDVAGVHFFSLQKSDRAALDRFKLIDLMGEMADFADTAALIANLDLVISVDTAVAHLAAALGKPVWLLNRFDSCWRWMVGRDDSPWYPTMRLYRQKRFGDWDKVVTQVAQDLRALVGTQAPAKMDKRPIGLATMMEDAVRSHRAGRLDDAAALYGRILAADPRHSDSLHLMGVVHHQIGRRDVAIAMINQAIALQPAASSYHANLAAVQHAEGRLEEAIASLRQSLALAPDNPDALKNLAGLWCQHGRSDEAIDCLRRVLAIRPALPDIHNQLGNLLKAEGRLDEAVACFRRALELMPTLPGLHNNLGNVLLAQARWGDAETCYRRSLELRPESPDASNNLGVAVKEQGRPEEAEAFFKAALTLRPDYADAHNNLAIVLKDGGRQDEAVACYRRVVELRPDCPAAYSNLGGALLGLGQTEEAVACYQRARDLDPHNAAAHNNLGVALGEQRWLDEAVAALHQAIALKPDFADAHGNLGIALHQQRRLVEAVACYRRTLALKPDYPEAHLNLGIALLALGDMPAGWEEYEWRWMAADGIKARRTFAQPQWQGEKARARTLLVHAEQGFGDTLQFCRYASLAAAAGFRVILEVQAPLVRLLRGLQGVHQVVARGEALPAFDVHCPLLSMPLAMRTTLAGIPGTVPYLRADDAQTASWAVRLAALSGDGLRVGVVWAGSPRPHLRQQAAMDRRRSLAADWLAPVFDVKGVQFFSLQKDAPATIEDFPLHDFMPEMKDFADTAALVANLDLVISVDTAVAHLAAALGKPVWLLDRFDSCWRWLVGRRDSPWYPGLLLYRQPHPGDWEAVMSQVARDLRTLAGGATRAGRQ